MYGEVLQGSEPLRSTQPNEVMTQGSLGSHAGHCSLLDKRSSLMWLEGIIHDHIQYTS